MISHRLVARVVVETDVNTTALCLSAHFTGCPSLVVSGAVRDGVVGVVGAPSVLVGPDRDGVVVAVSVHIGNEVVCDGLL